MTIAKEDYEWYRSAVFCEMLVRAFFDSDNNGSGDLKGLTEKLGCLQWLGVNCLWLSSFYDSPLYDGGYDIRDFRAVLEEFGTIGDSKVLLDEVHARGIRAITDLVMNHTPDSHEWSQQLHTDPDGPYGNFYVWTDDPDTYSGAHIIFADTEDSNWTYDPVRGQYCWHRFFPHQPDLNYDSPVVQEAILDVLRFWFDLGIDSFRLGAVPYLFERESTNCENLPETHVFLKRCHKVMDEEYPGRVLLTEVSQWSSDVVGYLGDPEVGGDEYHMAFHFPFIPRILMAVRKQSRFPISEILESTPEIPSSTQWGIFLRNHDELTSEMVIDAECDCMYAEYAHDPRMKANIGIHRRLVPLLQSDRTQLEPFNTLLLSLPGSPVLYYGDEISMGDNIWLGDHDGVCTPMQWSSNRNTGFPKTDPGRLYLPTIQNATYGYQVVNVENQASYSNSLLNWVRRLIQVRKRYEAFGLGDFRELNSDTAFVLTYLRTYGDEALLCVDNLSSYPAAVSLDLSEFVGATPVELTGSAPFPTIGTDSYQITLPGHGFYWFEIQLPPETNLESGASMSAPTIPAAQAIPDAPVTSSREHSGTAADAAADTVTATDNKE